jgi:hypothetical protein
LVGLPLLLKFPPVMKHTGNAIFRLVRRICISAGYVLAAAIVASATPAAALAQYPDTYMLRRGVLRMSFEPTYTNWNHRFDSSGVAIPLGSDFSFDSTAGNFYPTMTPVERAIWSITGDSTLRITAGAFRTQLEADVRRFPFNFRIGLLDRLTFTASIPVVTSRVQVDFTVDSSANVGWNQASAVSTAAATAVPQILALLGQVEASANALDATVSSGGLDCPSGPQCDSARDLISRARSLVNNLIALTGVDAAGNLATILPPFAPLSGSASADAIADAISGISAEFQIFGAPGISGTLPLPTGIVSPDSIQSVLTETTAGFGYDAMPLEFTKYRQKLGDLELGLRFGILQGQSLRAVLSTTVRLPTGTRDAADNYVDIGTGDKQTDVEVGLEAAFEPGGTVGISVAARYNLQLGDQLERRLSPTHQPIALAGSQQLVTRNLGDVISLAAYPTLRLNQAFRAYGAIQYYRKGLDTYSGSDFTPPSLATISATDRGLETAIRSLSLGAGIHFRSSGRDDALSLPAEAGIYYFAAYHGSGGFTPKMSGVTFYLRLFRRLFGGGITETEVEVEPEEPVVIPPR